MFSMFSTKNVVYDFPNRKNWKRIKNFSTKATSHRKSFRMQLFAHLTRDAVWRNKQIFRMGARQLYLSARNLILMWCCSIKSFVAKTETTKMVCLLGNSKARLVQYLAKSPGSFQLLFDISLKTLRSPFLAWGLI